MKNIKSSTKKILLSTLTASFLATSAFAATPILQGAMAVAIDKVALKYDQNISSLDTNASSASNYTATGITVSGVDIDTNDNSVVLLSLSNQIPTDFVAADLAIPDGITNSSSEATTAATGVSIGDMQPVMPSGQTINSTTNGVLVDNDTVIINFSEVLDTNSTAMIQGVVNGAFGISGDVTATVSTDDYQVFTITFGGGANIDITSGDADIVFDSTNTLTDLNGNSVVNPMGFEIKEASDTPPALPKVAEFDLDNDAKYSAGDTIYIQFNDNVVISEITAATSGVLTQIGAVASDSSTKSLGTGATLTAVDATIDITTMNGFETPVLNTDNGTANTFILTLGTDTDVTTGDNILITSSGITAFSSDIAFPLLAIADATNIVAEIEAIRTELNNATDIPDDIRTSIEDIIAQMDAQLVIFNNPDSSEADKATAEANIIDLMGKIKDMKDMMDDKDALVYGADASKITGSVILPTNTTLTPAENCFDNNTHMPLASCNAVFIDVMSKTGEWLGSTMVESDGSYNLYFRPLDLSNSETVDAVVNINLHLDGKEEHYLRDFGADKLVGGAFTDADSFKSDMEVNWVEDATTHIWTPDINTLTISTQETNMDLDISNMDGDKYVVEGTVVVPSDFVPGEIWNSDGTWAGFKMVNLIAIDTATGKEYRTEVSKTTALDSNSDAIANTYPFKFKLPNSSANYIIKIEKFTDTDGASEWVEMYLDDGDDDRAFDGDETLISATNIMWNETSTGSGVWTPDTTKTGYFAIGANVSGVSIDISTFGSNFYKIAGAVTPPSDFDMSDKHNNMNVDVIDAKTGMWLGGSPVMCDASGCTYSVVLGDTLNNYDGYNNGGYIIQINQNHWDDTNWENSWWKGFYFDLGNNHKTGIDANGIDDYTTDDTIKDEMDVRWEETGEIDPTYGFPYMKPNVNELSIDFDANKLTTVDISFSNYSAPTTYSVDGSILGIPANSKWANVHMYDPINYVGNGADIKSDNGSFNIQNMKTGKYILEVNYDVEDNGEYKHYYYIITDDDGDFTNGGTTAVDGMDVRWMPFATDGTPIAETSTWDPSFDWTTVAYWAPKVDGRVVMVDVTSDTTVSTPTITQATFYDLTTNISGAGDGKNINFNLFVPNEPIGRWESSVSELGDANVILKDLKERDDYQLQIWVDGLGEFWYDKTANSNAGALVSDVIWVGMQDTNGDGTKTICENWSATPPVSSCTYNDTTHPVIWKPNITGFSISADTTLNLAVPNDRAKITATLALGSDYANKFVDVNMWQNNGTGFAWENFQADSSGNVAVAMSVKQGTDYRLEVFIPDMGEGFVVDLGTSAAIGGTDAEADTLITNQNSWKTDGAWGPKDSTLIDASSDVVLGTLTPPSLNTLTFTINNLDDSDTSTATTVDEQMFIDLEKIDATSNASLNEWYGMDNADWTNWQNPTHSNTITIKVPAGDYRVMIHPTNHKGGAINNGDGNANDTIAANAEVTSFSWDWSKADKISVSGNSAYTITLPVAADMKSISGTVSGITGDMSGWIQAWSPTVDGNGAEVSANGTFEIKGLTSADDYTLEYWAWNEAGDMIRQVLGTWETADDSTDNGSNESSADNILLTVAKSSTVHTFTGTVTNSTGEVANISVLLLDVVDSDNSNGINAGDTWEVIEDVDAGSLTNSGTYDYTFTVPPALAGHAYAVAVGVKTVDATTGETTFTLYEASIDSDNSDDSAGTTAVVIDNIDNSTDSVSITVKETHN